MRTPTEAEDRALRCLSHEYADWTWEEAQKLEVRPSPLVPIIPSTADTYGNVRSRDLSNTSPRARVR